jgi:hypothetical protein
VGSVIVAVLAIIASSYWNYRTLRQSAATLAHAERTFERAEERYIEDRLESRNEKVRGVLFDLSSILWGCTRTALEHATLLNKLAHLMTTDGSDEDKRESLRQQIRDNYQTLRSMSTEVVMKAQTAVILSDWASLRTVAMLLAKDMMTLADIAEGADLSSADAIKGAETRLRAARSELDKHMDDLTQVIAEEMQHFAYKPVGDGTGSTET